jgi:hypothetical protein
MANVWFQVFGGHPGFIAASLKAPESARCNYCCSMKPNRSKSTKLKPSMIFSPMPMA